MKIKLNKDNITFTNVLNESLLESIIICAEDSGCTRQAEDYGCKQVITGNLDEFIKLWNKEVA